MLTESFAVSLVLMTSMTPNSCKCGYKTKVKYSAVYSNTLVLSNFFINIPY